MVVVNYIFYIKTFNLLEYANESSSIKMVQWSLVALVQTKREGNECTRGVHNLNDWDTGCLVINATKVFPYCTG